MSDFTNFVSQKKIMGNVNKKLMSILGPFLAIFWLVWANFMICTCSWIPNLVMRVFFFCTVWIFTMRSSWKRFSKLLPILLIKIEHVLMFFVDLTFIYNTCLIWFCIFSAGESGFQFFWPPFAWCFADGVQIIQNWANGGQKSRNRSSPAEKMQNMIKHVL